MKVISLFVLLISWAMSFAQPIFSETRLYDFVSKASAYNRLYPREKAFLHFDNTAYYVGDTIWFKAYVVAASSLCATDRSGVLYVELLAPEGYVMETKKLKIDEGQCHGEFYLDRRWYSGYYEVRAYTRHMLNWGAEAAFSRVFPVYERPQDRTLSSHVIRYRERQTDKKKDRKPMHLNFFPEGGHLITGIPSKVAFTLQNSEGKALDLSGKVYNSQGEEISSWKSSQEGQGCFMVCPDGEKMTAVVHIDKDVYKFKLPESIETGMVVKMTQSENSGWTAGLYCKGKALPCDSVGTVVFCRGTPYLFRALPCFSDSVSLHFPREELQEGVNRFVVFDKEGKLLTERQFFVRPDTVAFFTIAYDTKEADTLAAYQAVTLHCRAIRKGDKPLPLTTFSLAVRDGGQEEVTSYTSDIYTDLLLSSDLKGYIPDVRRLWHSDERLDLVMLIHGWTCHHWEQMCGVRRQNLLHPVEKGIVLDGRLSMIRPLRPFMPQKEWKVASQSLDFSMKIADSLSLKQRLTTNADGRFGMRLPDFYGMRRAHLVTKEPSHNLHYRFWIDRWFSPSPRAYHYQENHFPVDKRNTVTWSDSSVDSLHVDLEEALVVKKRRPFRRVRLSHPLLHFHTGNAVDYVLDNDEWSEDYPLFGVFPSIMRQWRYPLNYLQVIETKHYVSDSLVPEGKRISASYRKISRATEIVIRPDMQTRHKYPFPLDSIGKPRGWICFDPEGDESVYAYYKPSSRYPDYVVCVVLSNDKDNFVFLPTNRSRYTFIQGYSFVREFYSPDYSHKALPLQPDIRRTLYWNPNVRTDFEGRTSVRFYNNATCRRLRISAATVTSGGIPIALEQE